MKLVIPIFHTEFDALKVSYNRLGEIPPFGDFAIFGGYFGYFLPNSSFLNSMIYHFGEPMVWVEKWPKQIF